MHKMRAIAWREYLAAVRTKAFIFTILLMPVLIGVSIGLQLLFAQLDAEKEKKYAVIDRTPGQKIAPSLQQTVAAMKLAREKMPELRGLFSGKTSFEVLTPSEATPEAMAQQRYEVSRQIKAGSYEALIEIGPKVLEIRPGELFVNPDNVDDDAAVRFQAKGAGAQVFGRVLQDYINAGVQLERFQQRGISPVDIAQIQQRVPFKNKALTERDPVTGTYTDAADETRVITFVLPGVLIGLMFLIVMMGAAPAMHVIIEEKSQRIAEVLLGSATPFQLMAGKLLGVIGVALTMAVVYLGGGYFLLSYFGHQSLLPLRVLAWFLPMLILALLIFGSLFIAVGAAAADIKDTQTLLMPVMLTVCLPMFALVPIMQDPNGPIARVCSFFPFTTPMLLVARESVPPGVPWWEMLAGIALVLATTWFCVWAAGRIFRIGILAQGKGPKFADLVRWAIRG